MKWEKISSTGKQDVYELWHNDRKLLMLDFHPSTSSARIHYADEKRVFLIRKEGFRRNKTVLCNEYGVRLGKILHDNKENSIELNNKRFSYSIQSNGHTVLSIYPESSLSPLVECELNESKENSDRHFKKGKASPDPLHSSLLLALCWYMFQPVAKESKFEFAMG